MDSFGNSEDNALVNDFIHCIDNNVVRYFDSMEMEIIIEELMQDFDFQYLTLAIEHAVAQFPNESIFRLYRVKKYILEFQMDNAEKELAEIENSFPPSADIYIEKAFLSNMSDKKKEKSIKWLKKALALEPNDPDIHFLLGQEFVKKNDILTAIKHVSQALRTDTFFAENLFAYSYLFEDLDKPVEGIEFFTILTEEFPFLGAAWFGLGFTLSWNNRYEEAIDAYLLAITCDGEMPASHFNMANAFFELKDYDKALHHYFEAYNLDKEDFYALTNIGDCYAIQKWFEESLEYYFKALDINPIHNEAVLGVVNALCELEKTEEARAFILNTFEKNPQNIELIFSVISFFEDNEATSYLYKLTELTLKHLDDCDHFFFFIAQFCIYNQMYEVGINLINEFLFGKFVTTEVRAKMFYYLAALHFLNEDMPKGSSCLCDALTMNFEWHKNFMELSPLLETYPEVLKLIELYG